MKIKKILVAVDGSAVSLARLETGLNMARLYDATVSALYVMSIRIPAITSGGVHGGWFMGDELLAKSRSEANDSAQEVKVACERISKQHDIPMEWLQREGEVAFVTNSEARYYDILLLGKPDTVNEPQVHSGEINSILLGCGKPCLVIPGATPQMKQAPRNIVLGWDGSREASQAINYSLSFLVSADSVMVVTVHKHKEELEYLSYSNQRITEYLKEHGVPASSHMLDKKGGTTSQVLVNYAIESESDMLVMGSYGHSRFREIVLGGATKDMLADASLPVLYAH